MTTTSVHHAVSRLLSARLPKLCVAVTGSDANDLMDKAEALSRDNSFVELRLDYLSQPAQALPRIKRFGQYFPHITVIATCRRAVNGGKFRGSAASQLEILSKAAAAGCQLVDIEVESASSLKKDQ